MATPAGARARAGTCATARDVFERHFGITPPVAGRRKGALSNATLELLAEEGFRWSASGEERAAQQQWARGDALADAHALGHTCQHRVYRVDGNTVDCFFRDDGLSDLIGFTYSEWHARGRGLEPAAPPGEHQGGLRELPRLRDRDHPRRRERLGVLPRERLLLPGRAVPRTVAPPGLRARHLQQLSRRP